MASEKPKNIDPADKNKDGTVSKREQAAYDKKQAAKAQAGPNGGMPATGATQDRLNRKELRAEYKYTAAQLRVDKGLFDLFQKAFAGQWNKERFDSEVEQLDWYRTNKASLREYMLLKANGGADWDEKRNDSYEAVRQTAMRQGVNLSEDDLWDLAEQSMMHGWGSPGQEYELARAINERQSVGGVYGGDIAGNADNLKAVALANNVKLDANWYISKGKSIAAGLSLAEDVEREIREMAAQKVPAFGDRIRAGEDLDTLVSPWRRMMAEEWELADTAITLDDPMLTAAFGGFDEKGNPKIEDLGSFQTRLRKDPRWKTTAKGQNTSIDSYAGVLKMFGYGN